MPGKPQNISKLIKWNEQGLVPAIAQDFKSKEILMLAYMNEAALKKTLTTGFAHYFSRSRNKLWKKGETSNQLQEVKEILIDCDFDSVILKIKQHGVACHTGRKSCFFNKLNKNGTIKVNQKIVIKPEKLYGKKN